MAWRLLAVPLPTQSGLQPQEAFRPLENCCPTRPRTPLRSLYVPLRSLGTRRLRVFMKNFKRSSPRERGGTYRECRGVLQGPHGGRNNQTGERGREGGERSRHLPRGRARGKWISYHPREGPRNEWSRGQLSDWWKLGRWSCQADVARGHLIPVRA